MSATNQELLVKATKESSISQTLRRNQTLLAGLVAMRKMHIRVMEETGLTSADEMLYPENWQYLKDILSYVAVSYAPVENQRASIGSK